MWKFPLYAINMVVFFLPFDNKEEALAYGRAEYSQTGNPNKIKRGKRQYQTFCSC